jgi:hypoxanthine phosphoribosyltransferase
MALHPAENLYGIEGLAYQLADKIAGTFPNGIDRLVTIGRVGAHLGNIIGRELRVDERHVLGAVLSREEDEASGNIISRFVHMPSASDIEGQRVVVIDGVALSGRTLDKVTKYLVGCEAESIHTGVLFNTLDNVKHGIHVPTWSLDTREMGYDEMLFPWNVGRPGSSPRNVVILRHQDRPPSKQ